MHRWAELAAGACSQADIFERSCIRRMPYQRATLLRVVAWLTGMPNCSSGACSHKSNFRHETIRRTPYQGTALLWVVAWLRRSVGHNWLLLTLPLLASMYFGSMQNNFTTRPKYSTFLGLDIYFFIARPKKLQKTYYFILFLLYFGSENSFFLI